MGRAFHIPSYQRGYRWTEVEVKALLDDLWEFAQRTTSNDERNKNKDEFYCLQPIVLKENPDTRTTDLLDGQQRLTTLYLILSFLADKRQEKNYHKPLFSLSYATRQGSQEYLQQGRFRADGKETRSNIDYYHFAEAYKCIERWFNKVAPAHPEAQNELLAILLGESGARANVRLIEYKLEDDSKPIEVFLRLNQGKIPLTDAELVKALLLQADQYAQEDLPLIQPQLDLIASEWYEVERALAQADRWAFIAPSGYRQSDTHVDLPLELVARRLELTEISGKEVLDYGGRYKHPCYLVFALWLEQQKEEG